MVEATIAESEGCCTPKVCWRCTIVPSPVTRQLDTTQQQPQGLALWCHVLDVASHGSRDTHGTLVLITRTPWAKNTHTTLDILRSKSRRLARWSDQGLSERCEISTHKNRLFFVAWRCSHDLAAGESSSIFSFGACAVRKRMDLLFLFGFSVSPMFLLFCNVFRNVGPHTGNLVVLVQPSKGIRET